MRVCSSGFGVVIRVRVRCVGSLIIILRGKEGKKEICEKGGKRRWWDSGYDVRVCWLLCGVVGLSVCDHRRRKKREEKEREREGGGEREILQIGDPKKKTGTQIPTNQLTEYQEQEHLLLVSIITPYNNSQGRVSKFHKHLSSPLSLPISIYPSST